MKIVPFKHNLNLNTPAEGYVRSSGLHMSDIYNSLYKELQPERFNKPGGPDELAMEYGLAFEEALESAMSAGIARRLSGERPGEFAALASGKIVPVGTKRSVIFSPDQFFYNGTTKLGEFKSTRMTIAVGIRDKKFDKWFCQMKAYAYPLKLHVCDLYALFINGHGKWDDFDIPGIGIRPPGPLLQPWEIEFTDSELKDNWSVLMRHAKKKGMDI